ncbi:adenosine receptor A3-like [Pristis pectinata]|uniref:adenosine receptor A3-like n=1 Tax=Pristis pectinata TaxID=685728 RepID=UPI00223DFBB6|nr:adenosine receptor A3-like [Pristis pectinata]
MYAVYVVLEVLIAVISILGNVLVCWAVRINRGLMGTTFFFILSLAVADVAVGVLCIPLAIVISTELQVGFYSCLFMSCALLVLTQSSILSLLAIAVDRYLRVKIPTRYRIIVTQKRAWIAIGICWLGSILIGLTPVFGWNNRSSEEWRNFTHRKCRFLEVVRMDYMVYLHFFVGLLTPLVITFGLYAEVFWIIRKQQNKMVTNATDSTRYFKKELKLAKSLTLILCLFATCWLPIQIVNCISYFYSQHIDLKIPTFIGILLSHANSAVNPVIYAWKIKKFRVSFHQIWNQYFRCKNDSFNTDNSDGQSKKESNLSSSV